MGMNRNLRALVEGVDRSQLLESKKSHYPDEVVKGKTYEITGAGFVKPQAATFLGWRIDYDGQPVMQWQEAENKYYTAGAKWSAVMIRGVMTHDNAKFKIGSEVDPMEDWP